jgi:uncharacterized protein YdcH (DUF465 family)
MYENRIQHLQEMHAALDKQIDGLEKTGRFNDSQLMDLKKQRLSLKDQISELQRRQWKDDLEYLEDQDE